MLCRPTNHLLITKTSCRLETSLNNLVTQMCEAGKQEALCLLPTGRWTDTIVDILEFKARNSGALAFPNYFKILYCFYTIRDDHQKGLFPC
jgi:hypothetical protein